MGCLFLPVFGFAPLIVPAFPGALTKVYMYAREHADAYLRIVLASVAMPLCEGGRAWVYQSACMLCQSTYRYGAACWGVGGVITRVQ